MSRGLKYALFAVALVAVWRFFLYSTYEHRMRLTVTVATPEGPRTAHAVWAAWCSVTFSKSLDTYLSGCRGKGEAAFIELPGGRHVIALVVTGPRAEGYQISNIAYQAFQDLHPAGLGSWYAYAPGWRGVRPLTGDTIPTLITFADINDPATARIVLPDDRSFEASFGAGYRLAAATLEMVPAGVWLFNLIPSPWPHWLFGMPITRGLEGRLPWWNGAGRPAVRAAQAAGLPLIGRDVESVFIEGN